MSSHFLGNFPQIRTKRLRQKEKIRALVREIDLVSRNLILPIFITEKNLEKKAISSLPGHYQLTLENLKDEVKEILDLGISGVILFGVPKYKDSTGHSGISDDGIVQRAIAEIKNQTDKLVVISDICFCEYMEHGHCGIMEQKGPVFELNNDKTLELLQLQSLSHAKAGADIIAPSGMVDGMVASIRQALDQNGFDYVPIMSYAAKYSSSLYAPFREAAEGVPLYGDRKSYQMDPGNGEESLRECALDIAEGADILMIKPAMMYLDVIYRVKKRFPHIPLAAYQVSGEYAMIKAAAMNGWVNEQEVMLEALTAIKRSGADIIISYASKEVARYLIER